MNKTAQAIIDEHERRHNVMAGHYWRELAETFASEIDELEQRIKKLRGRRPPSQRKHGHSFVDYKATPEYNAWASMKTRCTNANHRAFHRYGGRGIKVCERWLDSFEDFLADMGPRPSSEHSLDRFPNNDGNYEPSNCRWATWDEQARNRSTVVFVNFAGSRLTLAELSEKTGVPLARLKGRLRRGWPLERAVT